MCMLKYKASVHLVSYYTLMMQYHKVGVGFT